MEYHPRPQLKRSSWKSLSGRWEYAIMGKKGEEKGHINVPFPPEAPLSGVGRTLLPGESLTYFKHVSWEGPFDEERERLLLHFDAVDSTATLSIDGKVVLSHRGGYLPFETLVSKREFDITLVVTDPSDEGDGWRGKQSLKPGGIWYPAESGIWQEVWIEKVPVDYITGLKIDPYLTGFTLLVVTDSATPSDATLKISGKDIPFKTNVPVRINIENPHLWSPDDPYLYHFRIKTKGDDVMSYVGLRTFGAGKDEKGYPRLLLNGKPIFHHGLLDQGYFKGGLMTPPTWEEMENDILRAKAMGFNMLRKHVKIEPLWWYHLCDLHGILVWQDVPNGGGVYKARTVKLPLLIGSFLKDTRHGAFGRESKAGREEAESETLSMISHLYNVTSIAMWVVFNEGWGQFDSVRLSEKILEIDRSRTIDHASGWHDQKWGNICSRHVYFAPYHHRGDELQRVVVLSEFGGYGLLDKKKRGIFAYKKFRNREELTKGIVDLYDREIIPAKREGLAASVYTELSDVEQEENGLITYDRSELKVDGKVIAEMSKRLLSDS